MNQYRYSPVFRISWGLFLLSLVLVLQRELDLRIMAAFSCCILFLTRSIYHIDKKSLLIILFSIFYVFFCIQNGMNTSNGLMVTMLVSPFAFYQFGKMLVRTTRSSKSFLLMQAIMVLSFSINLYYRTIIDIREFEYVKLSHHLGDNLYPDDEFSSTLYALIASLGITCFSIFFTKYRKNLILLFFYAILTILSFICITHLVSRTGLFVLIFVLFTLVLYAVSFKKTSLKSLVLVCIFFGLGYWALLKLGSYVDVISAYDIKNSNDQSNISNISSRSMRWDLGLENLFKYPFGWSDQGKTYYAHNLWLDVDRVSGILPFVLLIAITVSSLKDLWKLIKSRDATIVPVILAFYVGILLCSFVEPVIEGLAIYFFIYMYIMGIVSQLSHKSHLKRYLNASGL